MRRKREEQGLLSKRSCTQYLYELSYVSTRGCTDVTAFQDMGARGCTDVICFQMPSYPCDDCEHARLYRSHIFPTAYLCRCWLHACGVLRLVSGSCDDCEHARLSVQKSYLSNCVSMQVLTARLWRAATRVKPRAATSFRGEMGRAVAAVAASL